uniref:Coiled-coil domain-containing protein 134-like n=1 Tax=Saccoglossus kowalevskii TaxID=10224 RepID=A0ABM0LXX3_SACKO|nr:PREDICTED: coiled-coil domain-containing protein 134-like [Saccoglossus kowalevskii]
MVFEKLFEVLNGARFILQQANYIPGEKFPTEEQTREALSSVLENTAFFGELLLRLPDISHDIYDKKSEWKDAMGWAVGFCEQSNVFEGIHYKMLNLMSQELNIIPRDPDYVNPYAVDQKMLFQGSEPLEKKKKKEKKPRKRGPRLSSKQEL